MSDSIFLWMPQLKEFEADVEFGVIRSTFESGVEQRRLRRAREVGRWKFNFSVALLGMSTAIKVRDEILTFFKARQGGYDNFFLPSWELEAKLASAHTSGTTITLNTDPALLGFSATAGDQGNLFYICETRMLSSFGNTSLKHEVRRIASMDSNAKTITFVKTGAQATDALAYTYKIGSWVQKAYRVTFANDNLKRSFVGGPYVWKSDIEFVEDIGDLY
jgi:hypothetical protein